MAAPVMESFASFADSTNQTSRTINKPTGTVSGDWLHLLVAIDGNTTINTPSGFTEVVNKAGLSGTMRLAYFKRKADGTEGSTFTISTSSEIAAGIIIRVSGADGTESLDVFSMWAGELNGTNFTGKFPVPQTYAACTDGSLVLYVAAFDGGSGSFSATPSGTTNIAAVGTNTSGPHLAVRYKSMSSEGYVGTGFWTYSINTEEGIQLVIVLRASTNLATPAVPVLRNMVVHHNPSSTSCVLDKPYGTVNDDLLILTGSSDATIGGLSPPGTFTSIQDSNNGTAIYHQNYYRVASSEGSSYTVAGATGQTIASLMRITGADPADPIHVSSVATGTTATPTASSITTSIANCLGFFTMGCDDDEVDVNSGTPSGWTDVYSESNDDSADIGQIIAMKDLTSTGATGSIASSIVASEEWVAIAFAIAPLTSGSAIKKVVNETSNPSETRNHTRGRQIHRSETQNIAEASARMRALIRHRAETENVSETLIRVRTMIRLLLETENNSESILKVRAILKLLADSENIGDTRMAILGKLKIIADAQNISELNHRNKTIIRLTAETLQISEVLSRQRSLLRLRNETINPSEVRSFIRTLVRLRNESIQVSEQIRNLQIKIRYVAESEQMAETRSFTKGQVRIKNESEQMVETIIRAKTILRQIAENLQTSETKSLHRGMIRRLNESISMAELFVKYRGQIRLFNEGEQVVENIYRTMSMVRRRAETMNLAEAIDSIRGQVRLAGDSMQISEVLGKTKTIIRQLQENLQLVESKVKVEQINKVISETERLIEFYSSARARNRFISETENVLEQSAKLMQIVRMLAEIERLVEQKSSVKGIVKYISEAEQTAESLLKAIGKAKIVSDSLNLIEQNRLTKKITRLIAETMNIGESTVKKLAGDIGAIINVVSKFIGSFFTVKKMQAEYQTKKEFQAVYQIPKVAIASEQKTKSSFTGIYKTANTGGKGDTD